MYLAHFNLKHKPFQISTDPRFLWMGEKHKEAFATLKYGVLDNKGFLLLTGDVGTGKTTLINALLKVLGSDVIVATVRDPVLRRRDFFNYIAQSFGMDKQDFERKGDFLNHFTRFLNDSYYKGKRVLLIIDESQKLKQELLEEVRLLSNIEREETKLLNIFFVGQNEFNSVLHRPGNRALRQRITVHYNIQPFTEEETGEYINHRLKVAGASKNLFQPAAMAEVYKFSKGYPRLINIVCDRAMLTGFVREVQVIDASIVKECAEELQIPVPGKTAKPVQVDNASKGGSSTQQEKRQGTIGVAQQKHSLWQTVLAVAVFTSLIMTILLGLYIFVFQEGAPFFGKRVTQSLQSQRDLSQVGNSEIVSALPAAGKVAMPVVGNTQNIKPLGDAEMVKPVLVAESSPTGDTAEDLGSPGNEQAAIAAPPALPSEKIVIPFGHDSILPTTESLEKLNLLAKVMAGNAKATIILRGYTDTSGNERYNQKLSEFRANAVKGYLVAKGIPEHKIMTIGGGEIGAQSGNSQSGSLSKRRVEIEVVSD